RVSDWADLDCSSTERPSRNATHRNPSHFGSYCQFDPVGISSTLLASMGKNGRVIGSFDFIGWHVGKNPGRIDSSAGVAGETDRRSYPGAASYYQFENPRS